MARQLAGFPSLPPGRAGLGETHLRRFRAALRRETRVLGSLPGAAHVILRGGRCVYACSDGVANLRTRARFGLDTLCALHGATKPLVAAAFLTLVDDGKVALSDPVEKHIRFPGAVRAPAGRRAAKATRGKATRGGRRATGAAGKGAAKAAGARARPTIRHLLSMTSGLDGARAVKRAQSGKVTDLAGFCDALADAPLLARPGSRYDYGFSLEVIGRVCELVSGQPLDEFVESRILRPLGMKDTHFVVPAHKRSRVAVLYDSWTRAGRRRPSGRALYSIGRWTHPDCAPGIMSPGGGILSYHDAGMYSTAKDYARFCQMILDGGVAANGHRVLRPGTVRELWRDSLAPYAGRDGRVAGWSDSPEPQATLNQASEGFWDRNSWTLLNTHVVFKEKPRKGLSRVGSLMWMGGGGGAFWVVDRKRKLVAVSMTQCFGGREVDVVDGDDREGSPLDCLSRPLGRDITPSAIAAHDEGAAAAGKRARGR